MPRFSAQSLQQGNMAVEVVMVWRGTGLPPRMSQFAAQSR